MSEKVREAFLDWYYQQEQFGDAHQEELWKAWQASRAELVVDLPDSLQHSSVWYDYASEAFDETIDTVKSSLDDAGVSYK